MKNIKKSKWVDLSIFSVQIIYLAIVILIAVLVSIISPATIYIDLIVICIVTGICIFSCIKEVKSRRYRIEELSQSVDIVLKDSLNLVEIPMVMIDKSKRILWENTIAKHVIPKEFVYDCAVKIEKILKQSNESAIAAADIGNGQYYSAVGNYIRFSSFDCMLISFMNKTEESNLKKILEDTRTSIGILFIDNYDETMQGLEDIQKSDIASQIDKEIRKWVIENNGVVTKIDKDKYAFFVEKKNVEQMEKRSFEILERVRNITKITKLPVTVSLGISYSESTLNERYSASNSALDIALGRGGDQVVVKKDKKFDFFGGSNLGLEKTNRVRARTISQALKELIEKSEKVYVMGHKNTDIDCVGASVGICKMAKMLGKEANIIVDTKCNSSTKAVIEHVKS